jgi:hypothetical protein
VAEWKQKGLAKEGMVEKASRRSPSSARASRPRLACRPHARGAAQQGINVDCISSSEMTMSCVIALDQIERGVKAVHDEFFANASATKTPAAVK